MVKISSLKIFLVSPKINKKAPKTFIINVIGAFFAVGGGIEPPRGS